MKYQLLKSVRPYFAGKRDFDWLIPRTGAILTILSIKAVVSKFYVNVSPCIFSPEFCISSLFLYL